MSVAFVDGGYRGDETQRASFEASRITVTVVKRGDRKIAGFVVLPRRWIVERTLGWRNRPRRLAKDFKASIQSARAWLLTALAALRRIHPGRNPPALPWLPSRPIRGAGPFLGGHPCAAALC